MNCGSCGHWTGDLKANEAAGYFWLSVGPGTDMGYAWGKCTKVIGPAGDPDIPLDQFALEAFLIDGEGYRADLVCREDFGCVLWEETLSE